MPSYQPVMHFIGRDQERAFLRETLRPNRIVTLCGPGGIGKTAPMRWAINDAEYVTAIRRLAGSSPTLIEDYKSLSDFCSLVMHPYQVRI
jgi:hypothetical protein